MSGAAFKLPARESEVEVTRCVGVLMGSMRRFVIDKDLPALEEFHRIGIPLDFALDYAVQRGCMPVIDALLNRFGVVPTSTTLMRAVRRGLAIRTMFLDRVQGNVNHLDAAVTQEHFDVAHALLERGVQPTLRTLQCAPVIVDRPAERARFIDQLLQALPEAVLNAPATLHELPARTSLVQFERALERARPLNREQLDRLLEECLRAAATAHARIVIVRGAVITAAHRAVARETWFCKSLNNPSGAHGPRMAAVFRLSAETGALFEDAAETNRIVRALVESFALDQRRTLLQLCVLLAHACRPAIRPAVHQQFMDAVARSGGWTQATREDFNAIDDELRSLFAGEPGSSECHLDSGMHP